MHIQSCWQNFAPLRACQSFYQLAGASMPVAIANFNNITARCCMYSTLHWVRVVTTSLKPNTQKIRLEPLRGRRDFHSQRFHHTQESLTMPSQTGTARLGVFSILTSLQSVGACCKKTNVLVSAMTVLCRALSRCHSIQREVSSSFPIYGLLPHPGREP
jgi:hypothetical protein